MAYAQSSQVPTHLVVTETTEYSISFLLSDKPKITFSTDNIEWMEVSTLNGSLYVFYQPAQISYKSDLSGINNASFSDDSVYQQGDQLCFSTNKPNTYISVIDLKGNILMSETIDSGNYYYPLSDLLPGAYIAKINKSTIKFIKR